MNQNPHSNGENGQNRDPKTGKFLPGGEGGPGRPRLRPLDGKPGEWLQVIRTKVDPHGEDWGEVIDKAVEQAKAGDRWARQFLATYLIDYDLEERVQELERTVQEMQQAERVSGSW